MPPIVIPSALIEEVAEGMGRDVGEIFLALTTRTILLNYIK